MAETPVSEFGARLKQARQARGISLAHIANVTKISVRALEAVERNDFSRLPGGIFTRAFVRAYAGEVGLDPEAALKQFLEQCPQEMAAVPTSSPASIDGTTRREWQEKLSWRHAAVVLVVIGLIAAATWLLLARPEPDAAALPRPPAAAGAPAPQPPERAPADVAREPAVRAASAPQAAAPAPARAAVPEPAVPLQLSLVFSSPCWMAVEADGARVAMRLFAAGERLDVAARGGISLRAGDAGAVTLTINGQAARPLGARGEVVTLRIDPDTWTSLLAR